MKVSSAAPGTLLTRTLTLLHDREKDILTIANESGIPFYWVRHFATGKTKDPSVNKVQALYEYLTQKQLEV